MGSCELEHRRGRWLAPAELAGFLEEVYETLLRQRLSAGDGPNYIVLGCHDSDKEIYCATERSRLTGRPFASTEEQAKEKLWMWLKKRASASTERKQDTDAEPVTTSPVVAADRTAGGPATAGSAVCDATGALSADASLRSESILARTEVEAVEWLRTRGYVVAPPYASPNGPQNVGPPPSYLEHMQISMSQPLPDTTGRTVAPAGPGEKRKRVDDWTAEMAETVTLPAMRAAPGVRTGGVDGGSRTPDGDTDEDDDVVVVSAPLRKKRRNARTKGTVRKSPPQRPSAPPRRTKTRRTALSSVVSYEEAADVTGVDVQAFDPVGSVDFGGDEGHGPTAEEEHPDVEVDPGEHCTDGDRTAEPTEIRLRGLRLADDPPPSSSPEEEVVASSLLALRCSTDTAPFVGRVMDDGGDGPFVSEDPAAALRPIQPVSSPRLGDTITRAAGSTVVSLPDAMGVAEWSAEDRRLYRHFCEDVKAAEGQWNHPSTLQGMANLREKEPLLRPTFLKCLTIARKTMGEGVIYEWRNFQEQGWEKRRRHGFGLEGPEMVAPGNPRPTVEPARRDVVAEAYRQFKEATCATTTGWKACFRYRRAAIGLAVQYEAYIEVREGHPIHQVSSPQHDRSMLLRALFREMRADWRDTLPDGFTETQVRDQGYSYEWRAFNQTIQDGRRWNILSGNLGLGALLLIDTSKNNTYIQRQAPIPVFAAWTRLIPRVRLDVKDVAARVEGYYDGMEDPSFYTARKLRPLKLERHAYRACSPSEQFAFSGSEGGRTPTADPGRLIQPGGAQVCEGDCAMDDFIQSSMLDDEDFPDLSVDDL
jgi:hypothetical protein